MGITVVEVTKKFGDFVALDDVSVAIPEGSLTALLGPSGSGKSTLLRVIAGLEEPDGGQVLLGDDDVTRQPARARGIGMVFQHYAAFKHMTVWENVAFGLKVRKRPKPEIEHRVHELLQLVQLEGLRSASRRSSRAASGSGWRWPGRSPSTPRYCCWMSPSARSTRAFARNSAPGSAAFTTRCT